MRACVLAVGAACVGGWGVGYFVGESGVCVPLEHSGADTVNRIRKNLLPDFGGPNQIASCSPPKVNKHNNGPLEATTTLFGGLRAGLSISPPMSKQRRENMALTA